MKIILIILLLISSSVGLPIPQDQFEYFNGICNTNAGNQDIVNRFNGGILSKHLSECYITDISKHSGWAGFSYYLKEFPIVNINLHQEKASQQAVEIINTEKGRGQVRFQKQCYVYLVSLDGYESHTTMPEITKIFNHYESNKRARHSYILVNEFTNHEMAKEFLQQPELKNYRHRAWTDIVPIDYFHPDESLPESYGFMFYYYCYYCRQGEEGISSMGKIYEDPSEVQSLNEIFPDVTENLMMHQLKITAPPAPPLVLISPLKNSKVNRIQGQQKNIVEGMASKYNFSYTLFSSPGGLTGSKLPNGTWTGVMGELFYGRADIGLSVATAYDRNEIVDFTSSVFYAFLVLVSTKPTPHFEWEAIFYPFKDTAWLALIASMIMTFYLYKFFHNQALQLEVPARKKWKSKLEMLSEINREIMTNFRTFYMTLGSMLEQGVPFGFNTYPSRIYATFWMFFGLIVTCAYRSKLFSFLISPTIETPPSSFDELSSSDYTWGMKSLGGVALLFITQSPIHYIRTIGEQMEIYTDKYSCLDKTFNERFTCIIYKAYIDLMMEARYWKLRRQFHVSDFVTPPVGSAWALPKFSHLLPNFDKMTFRLYEMGLADKYIFDYIETFAKVARAAAQASETAGDTFDLNSNYKNDDDSGPKPLKMDNVYGGFFILLFGAIIGVALLIFEKIKYNKILTTETKVLNIMKGRMQSFRRQYGKRQKLNFPQLVRIMISESEKK